MSVLDNHCQLTALPYNATFCRPVDLDVDDMILLARIGLWHAILAFFGSLRHQKGCTAVRLRCPCSMAARCHLAADVQTYASPEMAQDVSGPGT